MKNKLLILNLGVDAENTSLAFTQKWINELSLNYLKVDVITLKVGEKYKLNENVSLHYVNKNDSGYSKIHQLKNPASFQSWLNTLARNKWLDYIKSPRNDPKRHTNQYIDRIPLEKTEGQDSDRIDIINIFQRLSPKDREILALIDL